MNATGPTSAPEAASSSPIIAPAEKITLDTKDKLGDLKSKLEITSANPIQQKEIAELEKIFTEKKDQIITISRASLESLKGDINDSDEKITGKIDVNKEGELVYTETPISPEKETSNDASASTAEIADSLPKIENQVPPQYQNEIKNYIVDHGSFSGMVMKWLSNWITEIIKWIKGFFATFGIEDEEQKKDALAQINGFENAEEERRVTTSVKALKSSPITKWPPLSDVLKISHISDEDLTKILKDHPGIDFSNNKNIEAAFDGSFLPSEKTSKMRYLRIYETLRNVHENSYEGYKPKEIFTELLAGSANTWLDEYIPESESTSGKSVIAPLGNPPEQAPVSAETQELETEKLSKEISLLAQEIEDKAKIYPETTTVDGKAALKKFTTERFNALQEKANKATDINKILQGNIVQEPDKARTSEEAMKQIKISQEKAQKALQQIETEGTIDLEPLDPIDRNNLIYYQGKLYQQSEETKYESGKYYFTQIIYNNHDTLEQTVLPGDKAKLSIDNNTELTAKILKNAGCKAISYRDAQEMIKSMDDTTTHYADEWIYINQDAVTSKGVPFSTKLRNIKIND